MYIASQSRAAVACARVFVPESLAPARSGRLPVRNDPVARRLVI